ncbi:DUF433 domain-containing protein [Roseofilum acuticapitatum]|nr:DUF433 domain-containing protein [Roseofilum acuticapitatum]
MIQYSDRLSIYHLLNTFNLWGKIMPIVSLNHIEITPGVCGGRPRITGHRITVADISILYTKMGYSLEEIASKYELSLASVYAAMAYYFDHRSEIEARLQEDRELVERLKSNHSSKLQLKLQQLRNDLLMSDIKQPISQTIFVKNKTILS